MIPFLRQTVSLTLVKHAKKLFPESSLHTFSDVNRERIIRLRAKKAKLTSSLTRPKELLEQLDLYRKIEGIEKDVRTIVSSYPEMPLNYKERIDRIQLLLREKKREIIEKN